MNRIDREKPREVVRIIHAGPLLKCASMGQTQKSVEVSLCQLVSVLDRFWSLFATPVHARFIPCFGFFAPQVIHFLNYSHTS